nr:MAG TPA: tail collar fiber protein [Caudoviricetes sp.]
MTTKYFTVLTNYGTQAFARALATNQPLRLSSFAVGDGNGQAVTPTADRTALVKETHRANVSAVSLDPRNNKQIIIELTIPEDVGGFYIREMGVFDSTNKLVAYANAPESFKPTLESGSGKVQVLRMILKVSNSQAVTLSIDNSVIFVTRQQLNPKKITSSTTNGFDESGHTHEIEKADTTKAGIVQLSSDNNSDDESKAATPKAIKNIKGLIDAVVRNLTNYIPNSKKSNAINSNSGDTVATSAAVKSAFDRAVTADNNNLFQKIYVSSDTLDLDLTNRQQVINLFGDKYRQDGYLTFANHNNINSKITGLPLEVRSPIVMTFYMMKGYSIFYCHYVTLNRKFFSVANLNNVTYKLNWVEDITNTGEQTINHQLNIKTNGWGKLFFPIENGGTWRLEANPESEKEPRLNFAYKMLDNSTRYISFPV